MTDELQKQRQHYQQIIAQADSLQRLLVNVDFKSLVLEHLFNEYPLYLTEQLANYPKDHDEYKAILRQLDAVSVIKSFLFGLINQGQWAKDELTILASIPYGDDE